MREDNMHDKLIFFKTERRAYLLSTTGAPESGSYDTGQSNGYLFARME